MKTGDNIMACTCGELVKYTGPDGPCPETWVLNQMCRDQGFRYMNRDWVCNGCIAKKEKAKDKAEAKKRANVKLEDSANKPRRQRKVGVR